MAQRAEAVKVQGVGLDKLYAACGFWPTMLLHTTGVSLEARLTTAAAGEDSKVTRRRTANLQRPLP